MADPGQIPHAQMLVVGRGLTERTSQRRLAAWPSPPAVGSACHARVV
jgi:hypothetical protein